MTAKEFDALKHQRESVAAHLRWLDEVIDRERSTQRVSTEKEGPARVAPALTGVDADGSAALPDEVDVSGVHSEVRRGCFIYAAIAVAGVIGVVAYIYTAY